MKKPLQVDQNRMDGLTEQLARRVEVSNSELLMFNDFTAATAALFADHATSQNRVLVVGHATPNLQIAIDRAELETVELLGKSVFSGTVEPALKEISSDSEIIYVANPNRVNGVSLSTKELEMLAAKVPRGLLVIDEHYHEFYRVSGVPLINGHDSVVVLRSFTAGFSVGSDAGYVIGGRRRLQRFGANQPWQKMSRTLDKIITTTLTNGTIQDQRLDMIHDESLRIAKALNEAGIQNRLTPSDFVLFRVANPARVCNHMASNKVRVENLDGYPGLGKYLKYSVQSQLSNDHFLRSVRTLPRDYYHLDKADRLPQQLRRSSENREDIGLSAIDRDKSSLKKKLASKEKMALIGSE